ncbi:MAG: hypothetical protein Fur0022_47580 [Anaerolineales bacterium]
MKTRLLVVFVFILSIFTLEAVPPIWGAPPQTTHILEEAQTVYLGNLAREANGVPPLRWNRQLTNASRWFSWDSVENRPDPYCGHQDTNGQWPVDRAFIFGYLGFAGAENAFCGYVTPQQAIDGWMNSPGHQANLLDPNSREIGLGYYLRESDGRGYVTQMFGVDPVYPPVIIEKEALSTTTSTVDLYIYDRSSGGGFKELGPATEMMVSNEPCFLDSVWEPYASNKTWNLATGEGWREVYVKTRDLLGRTSTVSDTIYLGENLPEDELSLTQAASTSSQVTLYGLDGGSFPSIQMSLSWFADDTYDTFQHYWGNGQAVNDPDALGGTAFVLQPGDGESFAWVWTTDFFKDTPLVAYVRLKVNDNSSANEVARFSVSGGGVDYGPLSLSGTDFDAPNQYQEFALPFTFHDTEDDFLIFNFWRSGNADVYVDGVYIFTTPVPITDPLSWNVPGGNYRGQGVWVRYTNGTQFSEVFEANTYPIGLAASPESLFFMVEAGGVPTYKASVQVNLGCDTGKWEAVGNAPWLYTEISDGVLQVWADPASLGIGTYVGEITISAPDEPSILPIQVSITLLVVETIHTIHLPVTLE